MTFSIVARDPGNGRFAVAVATFHLAVGATVPHLRRNTGAAASQGATNPYLAHRGLEALGNGLSANEALEWLLKGDDQRNARQIQLVDAQGRSSAWTGEECNGFAGHLCGENFSVAGNWLESAAVLEAMADAFRHSDPNWKIGRRVLSALAAGEAAGGDRRSPMASSAALQVSGELDFPLLDLRVDFNANAVTELQHLYEQSQQNWVQHWRDQFAALPDGRPRPAEDGGLNAGVA